MRSLVLFLALILLSSCSHHLNRLNKNGQRTGKWITYMDDEKKVKSFEGRFRNGLSVGKTYYYDTKGVLDRKEVARFKKLKTTFYYPTGLVKSKGQARVEVLPDKIHYYYYGKWSSYNEKGVLEKYEYYNKGVFVRSVYVDKNNKINDSLIYALNEIENEFKDHHTRWHDSILKAKNDNVKKAYYKQQTAIADSLTYIQITKILSTYGYPSSDIASDAYITPFYLIGFAPIYIKEKHYELLKAAAIKGILPPKSFAFFADKLRIAKGQLQLYGTQSYYDKSNNEIFYPCEDPENLGKRRKSLGIEE